MFQEFLLYWFIIFGLKLIFSHFNLNKLHQIKKTNQKNFFLKIYENEVLLKFGLRVF